MRPSDEADDRCVTTTQNCRRAPTTGSRGCTTRGAGASSRTSRSTSPRRGRPPAQPAPAGDTRRRARRRHRPDRRPRRGGGRARDRRRLVGRDARGLPRARGRRPASRRCSTSASATSATRRSTSGSRSSPARSAPTCTSTTTPSASRALEAARELLVPGGLLDLRRLRAVAGRHRGDAGPLARARARDLGARRLGRERAPADALASAATAGETTMTLSLALRPGVARRCSSARASRSRPATAGSTAARTRAARTPSGSPGVL